VSDIDDVTAFMKQAAKQQALNSLRNQPRGVPAGWNRSTYAAMLQKLYENAIKSGATPEEIKATGFSLSP
jgi:hypothetical protein